MSSYHCYDDAGGYNGGRFYVDPEPVGLDEWRKLIERLPGLEAAVGKSEDEDPLLALRMLHRNRSVNLNLWCPRVFVSHRRCDADAALRAAYLANLEGFDYWLDILDPEIAAASINPSLTDYQRAVLLAAIIEMALLNCTHVLAIMTQNVVGTLWMPYEYGRVKDSALVSVRSAGWFHSSWNTLNTPEYFHLGPKHRSDGDVQSWLAGEFARWLRLPGAGKSPCPSNRWPFAKAPAPLPDG
jgi:hypothetical protein